MVFEHIHTHMMTHSLYPEFQSAYRKNHSTETALVRVMNDILMTMNTQEVTLLVMVDLSATFDTVNHNILLTRLNEELGICGLALEWFRSYLAKIGQRVSIDGSLSGFAKSRPAAQRLKSRYVAGPAVLINCRLTRSSSSSISMEFRERNTGSSLVLPMDLAFMFFTL